MKIVFNYKLFISAATIFLIHFLSDNSLACSIKSFFLFEKEYFKFGKSNLDQTCNFSNSRFFKNVVTSSKPRKYDVISYDLYLNWYNPLVRESQIDSIDKIWNGKNKLKIFTTEDSVSFIELHASSLIIDSVFILINNERTKITPTPKVFENRLDIPLPFTIFLGDTLDIEVFYTYARNIGYEQYRGFYLYPKGMFVGRLPAPFYDSVFVEEKLVYTMSEPEDARFWMPCNDEPSDKAMASITVRVPRGFIVASNGFLDKVTFDGDSAVIYFWISDKPITTYLMSATASKYILYYDWYKRVTTPTDSIQVQYYVWEKDFKSTKTDGSEYNAQNTFQTVVSMLEFFSNTFFEYPFVKYGMVSIMPFNFGGMEHQTITSINRLWLRINAQFGIAHELAHQWIGDLVTCATWNDIWFNEGGATWSEALYAEKIYGHSGYNSFKLSARSRYLKQGGLNLPPIYALPINTIFGSNAVLVYQKASWIYHMLQKIIGDSLFFSTFRSFLRDYSYKSIQTQDIIEYFKTHIPNPQIDFDTFFDQWLFSAGHPVFLLNSKINTYPNDSNYYNAIITIEQIQQGNNVPEVFKTPIKLIFKNQGNELPIILIDTAKVQQYHLELPFPPDSIFVDTTFILCEVGEILLSTNDINNNFEGIIYPNPTTLNFPATLVFSLPSTDIVEVNIYDFFGRKIKEIYKGWANAGKNTFSIETNGIAHGTYYLRIQSQNQQKVFPLVIN